MLFRSIAKIVVAVNSNRRTGEMAAGAAFGLLLALIPSGNLLWACLLLITLFIKINLAVELVLLGLFKLVVPLFDGPLHRLGYLILTIPGLESLFTNLTNLPIVPFTKFNNTIVMGGLAAGVALWFPVFFLFRLLIKLYRKHIRDRIAESRIVKNFLRLPLVSRIAGALRKATGLYAAR